LASRVIVVVGALLFLQNKSEQVTAAAATAVVCIACGENEKTAEKCFERKNKIK
jgi:hypothetical protein